MPIRRLVLSLATAAAALLAAAPAAQATVTFADEPGYLVHTRAASVPYTFTSNDPGATLYCKAWRYGTPEPAPVPCGAGGAGSYTVQLPEEGEWRLLVAEAPDAPLNHWQWRYVDADRTAPRAEVAKMSSGWRGGVADDMLWESTARFRLAPWMSTQEGIMYECRQDDGPWTPCASDHSWSGIPDGTHVLTARASDRAGNVQDPPSTYRFTVDTTPPDTTFVTTPPATGASTPGHTFVAQSSEGGATFRCFNGASSYVCTGPTQTVTALGGTPTFRMAAVDAAGNVDPTPATYTWTVGRMAWDSGPGTSGPLPATTVTRLTFPRTIKPRAALYRAYRRAAARCARGASAKARKTCVAKAKAAAVPEIAWKLSRPAGVTVAIVRQAGGKDTVLQEWKLSTARATGTFEFDGAVKGKALPKGAYAIDVRPIAVAGAAPSAAKRVRFRVG